MDADDVVISEVIDKALSASGETYNTLKYSGEVKGTRTYSLGSKDETKQLFALKDNTLLNSNDGAVYIIPSAGVAKLLFESKPNSDEITLLDVDEYLGFLKRYNFPVSQL
jgi:hypothetical protein